LSGWPLKLEDHVAGFDSERVPPVRPSPRSTPVPLAAAAGRRIRQPLGDGLDHHTELAARDMAGGLQLLAHLHGDIDRDVRNDTPM